MDVSAGQRVMAAQESRKTAFLVIHNVHKRYSGVHALRGINVEIHQGEIYHLLGENGCGKSTLIKVISGAICADEGELVINGTACQKLTPIEALSLGIETVYQDLSLIPNLSVVENIGLTEQLVAQAGRLNRILDRQRLLSTAKAALAVVGLPSSESFLFTTVEVLPIAQRQLVAIARAIATKARLVIMDEPTTSLTKKEIDNLIGVIRQLSQQHVAVLFVSHKLDECFAIGGQVLVLKDGQKIAQGAITHFTKSQLGYLMTGRRVDERRYRRVQQGGEPLLTVTGLGQRAAFDEISFVLHRGEILGVTGLLDSGCNELGLALAGILPANRGIIALEGQPISLRQPRDAINNHIAYVPEDRLDAGLFLGKSILENLIVLELDHLLGYWGQVDKGQCQVLATQTVLDLDISAPNINLPVQALSGGNQQRVLIGRALTIKPWVLILHGPTVGVDVGAKDTIYRLIQALAKKGMGVILISDDLPELCQNCDRILVMKKGRICQQVSAVDANENRLYQAQIADEGLTEDL
ncbi:sugar ABC transporter ATP-binding protein [Yersinia similis]|uniref:sugar ABC transporter ATP-binding protein n=1 Tax=Yersinia similis TaxID=367190 RepID=UPI0011A10AF8|nr:sugar ABC transporter ATP-binding protein [Yersinia similis]